MYKGVFKRFFDVVIAVLGVVITSPILLIIAIAIKIDSKGPVIFKQERLGKNGKVFHIYKFRSMVVGAEHTGSGVYSDNKDSRITKVGKFLRATSLDELPQFFNLLKGDMSLICSCVCASATATSVKSCGFACTVAPIFSLFARENTLPIVMKKIFKSSLKERLSTYQTLS